MKRLLLSLTAGAAVLASAGAVRASQAHEGPEAHDHSVTVQGVYCPTEDSCSIDYQHGKGWVVSEVTP